MACVGLAIHYTVMRRLVGQPFFSIVLATIGIGTIIRALVLILYGPIERGRLGALPEGSFEIAGTRIQWASVVIVADHDTTRHADLEDLRSCLRALARQKVDQPVEFLLVETDERAQKLPAAVIAELPGLRVSPLCSPIRTMDVERPRPLQAGIIRGDSKDRQCRGTAAAPAYAIATWPDLLTYYLVAGAGFEPAAFRL